MLHQITVAVFLSSQIHRKRKTKVPCDCSWPRNETDEWPAKSGCGFDDSNSLVHPYDRPVEVVVQETGEWGIRRAAEEV